ncbi:hypothetical protein LY78DRAFT_489312 [Colletotrichum sublineola]|nr:hypothetical protein LY78DRAFT_489312 [Colletotrichum sublineola]
MWLQSTLRQSDSTHTHTLSLTHTNCTTSHFIRPNSNQTSLISAIFPCIAMYHCDITWNTPDPSEDQHKPEQGPQYQEEHQGQQSRDQVAVPTEHSHSPHQQQQHQHYDRFGLVNLLAPNIRGPELRESRSWPSFVARDFLPSHQYHQEPYGGGSCSHAQRASGQLRSISPPETLAPHQRTLLSPPPTASSVSQSLQARTSSATPTRPCVSSSRRPL